MEAAAEVNRALQHLSREEADFMARHHDEIVSFLSEGSAAIGISTVMFGTHLSNMRSTLEQLESLHQRTYIQQGTLQNPEFFSERKRLMLQLDNSLGPLIRKGMGIPDHPKLKSALGISTRRLIHHWNNAGAPGHIPGYATHIDGLAKASKYIKAGGWIGIALGASASVTKTADACRFGREQDCHKVSITEAGKFFGGLAGGAVGAPLGATACVALSVTGVGGIVCGIVMVGVGSVVGGSIGESLGEGAGEKVYEWSE
ncbi:hypothetical protein D3C76_889840 [compost metagenome]